MIWTLLNEYFVEKIFWILFSIEFWIESFFGPIQGKNEFSKRIGQGYLRPSGPFKIEKNGKIGWNGLFRRIFYVSVPPPTVGCKKQYEVNYEVSDREDGGTGVTTFTRMAAILRCTGLQLGCNGLFWAVMDWNGLYWVVLGSTGIYWALLGCTELYWTLQGCTGLHCTVIG